MDKRKRTMMKRLCAVLCVICALLCVPAKAMAATPLTYANFDSQRYANMNADLLAAFGYDHNLLWNHYNNCGFYEGRAAYTITGDEGFLLTKETFDFIRYADMYTDLKAIYGYNKNSLWTHYVNCGSVEGRLAYATTDVVGIDVSSYQGVIDWAQVKAAGIDYAIIRLGYRGSETGRIVTDVRFHANIKGAKNAGIKVGVYFVTQAINTAEAIEEANYCLSVLNGYALEMPVFVDVEGTKGRGDTIDRATRTSVVSTFCQTMTAGGRFAGVYTSRNWMANYIDMTQLTQYSIWLAQYRSAHTWTGTRVDLWQFTSSGSVPGIAGRVDMNRIYVHW